MGRPGLSLLLAGVHAAAAVEIGGSVGEMIPTELPRSEWPAATPTQSNIAWPSGHQPQRMEAWPQVGFGTPNRTLLPCWKTTVLHDTKKGWPGVCLNLFKAEGLVSEEACRRHCINEPRCPVWQFNNQTYPGQCWVGHGTDCVNRKGRSSAITVQAAQRIMHGDVRVIKNLTGWKVNNLWQMGLYSDGDAETGMARCRAWCYSSVACEYWQYGPGGCWLDAPMYSTDRGANTQNVVQYPLTTNGGASRTSPEALTMQYGEYIQHYCPPQYPAYVRPSYDLPSRSEAGGRSSDSWWSSWTFWLLLSIAVIALILTITYVLMHSGGDGNKRGRNRRRNGEDEDRPLMQMGQSFSPDQHLYQQHLPPTAYDAPEKPSFAYDGYEEPGTKLPGQSAKLPAGLPPLPSNLAGMPTVDASLARPQLAPTQLVDLNQLQAMRGQPQLWPPQAFSGPARSSPTYMPGPRYG